MKSTKKIISVILALVMSITCFSLIGFAEETKIVEHLTEVPEGYVGIYTKDDLDNVKLDMAGKYILMNDIIFEDSDYEKGGSFYNSGKGWEPIGTSSTKFTGTFDGNGYAIKNLYINNPEKDYIGLFGYVNNATIKNVTLEDANITGKNYVGGIAGYSYQNTTISYCCTQGTVAGTEHVGGIIGYQYSGGGSTNVYYNYIQYCNNATSVSGIYNVGGITGTSRSYRDYYYRSYGNSYVKYCSNSGTVTATKSRAGGIIGASSSYSDSSSFRIQYINYCYNSGEISASSYAGGVVGSCYSDFTEVIHCYSVGTVTATSNFGGCFGDTPKTSTFCYYLDEAVTNPTCTSGIAKSEDQLKKATTFEQWKFDTIWTMGGREDYPYPELVGVPLVLPEDYSAHEHSYTSAVTKEATHTETGVMTYTCECGDSYTEEIAKTTDHIYTSKITTPATHTTTGVMTYTCECGDSYTEVIEKIANHSYNEMVTAPTCEEQGYTTYTCECGYSYVGSYVNPTGHSYDTEIVAPTCTEQGYTTYTCACGNSYVGNYVIAEGHDYESVVTEPTCTEKGYTTYTCACGDSYVANYINAKGHSYTSEITTPATHLTTGVMTYTCSCGDTYTEEIAKTTEHTYTAVTTAPTCEDKGYTTYTCECGNSYVGDYVDAIGHNGNGDDVCDNCGETVEAENPSDNCSCNCHKSGISKFFFDFILFFQRIFGTNKTCDCGVAHY